MSLKTQLKQFIFDNHCKATYDEIVEFVNKRGYKLDTATRKLRELRQDGVIPYDKNDKVVHPTSNHPIVYYRLTNKREKTTLEMINEWRESRGVQVEDRQDKLF